MLTFNPSRVIFQASRYAIALDLLFAVVGCSALVESTQSESSDAASSSVADLLKEEAPF